VQASLETPSSDHMGRVQGFAGDTVTRAVGETRGAKTIKKHEKHKIFGEASAKRKLAAADSNRSSARSCKDVSVRFART
jgi:hypothetical protein